MRFATKIERAYVKSFIQKDKTITCPKVGDYYALIDSETGEILSALCVTHQPEYWRVQGMRTEKQNRGKGYATELLTYALKQYSGLVHSDCLKMSKGIFEKLGFQLVCEHNMGNHIEYQMEKVIYNAGRQTEERN